MYTRIKEDTEVDVKQEILARLCSLKEVIKRNGRISDGRDVQKIFESFGVPVSEKKH